jgi:hypothetical protein
MPDITPVNGMGAVLKSRVCELGASWYPPLLSNFTGARSAPVNRLSTCFVGGTSVSIRWPDSAAFIRCCGPCPVISTGTSTASSCVWLIRIARRRIQSGLRGLLLADPIKRRPVLEFTNQSPGLLPRGPKLARLPKKQPTPQRRRSSGRRVVGTASGFRLVYAIGSRFRLSLTTPPTASPAAG